MSTYERSHNLYGIPKSQPQYFHWQNDYIFQCLQNALQKLFIHGDRLLLLLYFLDFSLFKGKIKLQLIIMLMISYN